ncbi:MAG: Plug domain-containing protein, partial [Bacteroidales bacterium]|nr:Plug domain-containing protein [Bacteroidales bacterium]
MHILSIVLLLLAGTPEVSTVQDTLKASWITSSAGSLVVPQRISSMELGTVTGVSEAVRRFAGVQLRDYGGVGGLKTVNVRSLGSEHTGVFIDGIQVDNAQNMQVDLGRFGTDEFDGISLFSGQKTSRLQSAKEYSSASTLYLESRAPVFTGTSRDNLKLGMKAGSFGTYSPSVSWEHLFQGGASLRASAEALDSKGSYKFHVRDYRSYPDGTLAGYDTTMTRVNGDIRSLRAEGRLFGPQTGRTSWNLHAYYFDSERGLPGPVYTRAGGYPLSEDRQADRDAFLQGRVVRDL